MQYYQHLLIIGVVAVVVWCLFIYFWPSLLLSVFKRGILVKGFGDGPIPVNTLYTQPQKLFAEPLAPQSDSSSNLMRTGVNHDTLLTLGWLDLRQGPQDMFDRMAVRAFERSDQLLIKLDHGVRSEVRARDA